MILSMTGYADAQHTADDCAYELEIKSVNNRYFKASIKLPDRLSIFEPEVEKLLRSRLTRGSVVYSLRARSSSPDAAQQINTAALKSYVDQLRPVMTGDQVRIDLATILGLPGVCQPPEIDDATRQRQWATITELSGRAITALIEMRRTEGQALRQDLLGNVQAIREHLKIVAERAPAVIDEYHQKLLNRVNTLLSTSSLELKLDDVKREVALYAERCDVSEEVCRLSTHLDQFEAICDSTEPAGRKLDFLAQELLREANTIASKSNDGDIARRVVEIKAAIDRLKEQVQNVE